MTLPEPKASVQRLFNNLSTPYACFVFSHYRGETRRDVAWIKPNPRELVLDLACGPGTLALELGRYGCRVYAVDLAEKMISLARRAARRRNKLGVHFAVADAERLPLPSNCFDLVTCGYSLANFPALPPVVAEMFRVTRPGGRVAILEAVAPEDAGQRTVLNRLEQLRSAGAPARLLCSTDLRALFERANFLLLDGQVRERRRRLDDWLSLGNLDRATSSCRQLRQQILETAGDDSAGLHLERCNGRWFFYAKVACLLWRKQSTSSRGKASKEKAHQKTASLGWRVSKGSLSRRYVSRSDPPAQQS